MIPRIYQRVLLTITLAAPIFTYAQTEHTLVASVLYKITDTRTNGVDDICQLDIAHSESYFYSKREKDNRKQIDEKVAKAKALNTEVNFTKGEILTNTYRYKTKKDYRTDKAILIEEIDAQTLGAVQKVDVKSWKILNETTVLNGLLCRKATLLRDTTTITAWFTTNIPLREGPFAYSGLPGLIVKLNTSSGGQAAMISISYNKEKGNKIEIPDYALVSNEDLIKARANFRKSISSGKVAGGGSFKLKRVD